MSTPWLALLLLQSTPQAPIDVTRLLDEMVDRASIARLPEPAWTAQSSGDDETSAEAGNRTILDVEGPGAITCIASSTAKGHVSIWLDDAALLEPGVDREPTLVLDRNSWLVADSLVRRPLCHAHPGGARFYVPIPFSRRARIAVDGPASRIDWRRYADGTRVTSFARGDLERHRAAIERIEHALRNPATPSGEETFTFSLSDTNPGGELLGIGSSPTAGPRAVSEIRLRVDGANVSQGLRHCTLRLTFDGEETVSVPLGAFFGSQDEMQLRPSWFVSMEPPGDLVARWVMPYRERMTMLIDNAGDPALHVAGIVRTIPWKWDERSLHFHATWRAIVPSKPLAITGRGIYVGELVTIASSGDVPPDEAGAEIAVDGGVFRSWLLAQGNSPTFAEPLRGVVRCEAPGRSDAYRFRVLDAVPFANSLRHLRSEESGSSAERAACILYYARPGAKADAPALPRDPAEVLPARRVR